MRNAWSLASLALLFLQQPATREHPVPLPADFDPSGCVDCHADKREGKQVHAPAAADCTSCHTVSTENEVTRIALQAPIKELCLACHGDQSGDRVHAPYQNGECALCHDPHTSEFAGLTRVAPNELCAACHLSRRIDGSMIPILAGQEIPAVQFQKIPKIVLDRAGRTGHPYLGHPVTGGNDPFREGQPYSCLSCHEPHAASVPRLLRESWKELDVCEQCHTAMRKEGKKP
jgi:predicted CXXCH cytochrome family protein